MASLKIRDVKKSYGDLQVMHGVDLDVEEGEFVVFRWAVWLWQVDFAADDCGAGRSHFR